jgi:hypothetical protein
MNDRARLILTGIAALAVVGGTTAIGGRRMSVLWHDDRAEARSVREIAGLGDFAGVTQSGPDTVLVSQGKRYQVRVEGDRTAVDRIDLKVREGTLHVGRTPGKGWMSHDGHAVVRITLPRLDHAALIGSGNMRIETMTAPDADLRLTGSGDLWVGDLQAERARLLLSGSGNLSVAGHAQAITLDQTGSGNLRAGKLDARTAQVKLVGSGNVFATAHDKAAVSILGSGDAHIAGTTECQISKTGSGEASCKS